MKNGMPTMWHAIAIILPLMGFWPVIAIVRHVAY